MIISCIILVLTVDWFTAPKEVNLLAELVKSDFVGLDIIAGEVVPCIGCSSVGRRIYVLHVCYQTCIG